MFSFDGYFSCCWVIDQTPSAVPDRAFQIDPDFGGNGIIYGDVHARFIRSCRLWPLIHLQVLDLYDGACVTYTPLGIGSLLEVGPKWLYNLVYIPDNHTRVQATTTYYMHIQLVSCGYTMS